MFFKKHVPVDDYCRGKLTLLFCKEREVEWEALRQACNDGQLSQLDTQLYYNHLKAIFLDLMLTAISRRCSPDVLFDARVLVMMYLKEHNLSEIGEISTGYNRAFASGTDGIRQMVLHFSDSLAAHWMQSETLE